MTCGHAGEKTLLLWHDVAEKSNANLDTLFQKQGYNTKDMKIQILM